MKTTQITLLLLLIFQVAVAQTISKQVIGAAGKTQSNANLKVSYTVGEPVVGLMTAGGNQLGNGYPDMDLQALSVEDNVLDVQLKVYPNPTTGTSSGINWAIGTYYLVMGKFKRHSGSKIG
jgi:hypothetical protein